MNKQTESLFDNKRKMKIIQILPTISYGDAVGNDVLALKAAIEAMGYETAIYAENVDRRYGPKVAKNIEFLEAIDDDDIVIYHLSVGSELNYIFPVYKGRKIIIYHNITPAHFFEGYNNFSAELCRKGYEGAAYLSDKVDYCLAVSEYNKKDLENMGFKCKIDVLPILIPFSDYDKEPSRVILDSYQNDGYTNILFTGRIAPNKKQEDVILAFSYYQKHYNKKSRLFLVGNYEGFEKYYELLQDIVKKQRVKNVIVTGHIPFNQVLAYYRLAHAFVCMSEHEGFCVPLVEAMYFGVPIVARNTSAVGDTLGEGGVLLNDTNPKKIAETINRIVSDKELRKIINANQKKRLEQFSHEKINDKFASLLEAFIRSDRLKKKKSTRKICFVSQRYGLQVNGGAELHCRLLAEHMKNYYDDISVLTTKAIDYMTWRNEYAEDEEILNGIRVIRFPVIKERNQKEFDEINFYAVNRELPVSRELEWIEKQGPNTPGLLQYLDEHIDDYDVFIFFTYLYYPTVLGISRVARKAIVIPTAHDEPFLDMDIFRNVFCKPKSFFYNTSEERELVHSRFNNEAIRSKIGGTGVDLPDRVDANAFREKYNLRETKFVLYVGRIDVNKGCKELIIYFNEYIKRNNQDLKLVLMGKAAMDIPESFNIINLGYVSDEDKFNGMAAADVLIMPSKYESLSMVVLEAMSVDTLVLVNGECEVLKGHCIKSNGALYYNNYYEFEECLNYYFNNFYECKVLRTNAHKYINENYQWNIITQRLAELIEAVACGL